MKGYRIGYLFLKLQSFVAECVRDSALIKFFHVPAAERIGNIKKSSYDLVTELRMN